MRPKHLRPDDGFSLIEVVVVLALIAFVYTVAMPQLSLRSGAEVSTKLSQLAGDIRGAYDLSVLTGRPYRMVFAMASGDYWLEETDKADFELGEDRLDRDPSEQEEKDAGIAFDTKFDEYKDLAGSAVPDPKGEREIPPASPVLAAKSKLRRASWGRVESAEWTPKTLGPHLLFRDIQAEHHAHKQDLMDMGPDARAVLYFFPGGYVERAVMHIAYKKSDMVIDESQDPYTVVTVPYEGVAEVTPGNQDIDIRQDKDD